MSDKGETLGQVLRRATVEVNDKREAFAEYLAVTYSGPVVTFVALLHGLVSMRAHLVRMGMTEDQLLRLVLHVDITRAAAKEGMS